MGSIFYAIVLILLGIIGTLRGFKVFKIYLALSTFVLGFFFGWGILAGQSQSVQIIGSLIVGVLLGLVSFAIYKLGMFLIFFAISSELARYGIAYFNIDLGMFQNWVVLILSVIFSSIMLALGIEKIILIIVTSIGGSAFILLGCVALKDNVYPIQNINIFRDLTDLVNKDSWYLIIYLVLVFVGMVFQLRTVK